MKIKQLRIELLYTQKEFAELLGVATYTIRRWENGDIPTLRYKRRIKNICEEYNKDYNEYIGD